MGGRDDFASVGPARGKNNAIEMILWVNRDDLLDGLVFAALQLN